MPTQKINLGLKGLNADISPYSLPPELWNQGLNLRVKDGSIQTVPKAALLANQPIDAIGIDALNPINTSNYVPDGSTYLNNIVAGLLSTGNIGVYFSASGTDVGPNTPVLAPLTLPTGIIPTYNQRYGVDNFNFNELSIVNPKTSIPMYYNANAKWTGYQTLPDWLTTTRRQVAGTVVSVGPYPTINPASPQPSYTQQITLSAAGLVAVNNYVASTNEYSATTQYRVVATSGTTITIELSYSQVASSSATFVATNAVWVSYAYYARGMTQYQGRLIAFNLFLDLPGTSGDEYSPIELIWSQPITSLQSLSGVQWASSPTNSAGNDYITETPGEILAALQLNEYLIAYKADSVYLYQDTGAPSYLVAKQLYNDDGIFNAKTVVPINSQRHFVVGNKGIYIHQGGVDKQNISRGRIEEAFFRGIDGVDLNYRGITFCYHNILEKEVWVCYRSKTAVTNPISTGGLVGCNRAYCYNYLTDTWYQRSLDNVLHIVDEDTSGSTFTVVSQPSINYAFAPAYLSYFPQVAKTSAGIFEDTAYIQFDDRDLGTAEVVKSFNGVYPHTDYAIRYQLKLTNAHVFVDWSTITQRYFNPNARDYRLDYRETGRFTHMRILGAGLTATDTQVTNPYFSNIDIDVEGRGRR